MACAALTGPIPGWPVSPGTTSSTIAQLGAVGLERAGGLAQRHGQPADLAMANRLLTGGVPRCASASQAGQDGLGEAAASDAALGVVAVSQQGT
jgi:hypothetical protein